MTRSLSQIAADLRAKADRLELNAPSMARETRSLADEIQTHADHAEAQQVDEDWRNSASYREQMAEARWYLRDERN